MITIIGTSHIAKQSVEQIRKTIREFKPEIVAVELDADRASRIFEKPESPKFSNIFRVGPTGFTFALLGWFIQHKLGEKVGIFAGEDMRTAIVEARKAKLKIALIDQPIQRTFRNITKKMSRWEKTKMIFFVSSLAFAPLIGLFQKKQTIDLSKVPAESMIEESLGKIKRHFPGFYKALITDRNKYMVRQIHYLANRFPSENILIVVGAGHKSEIERLLMKPMIAG